MKHKTKPEREYIFKTPTDEAYDELCFKDIDGKDNNCDYNKKLREVLDRLNKRQKYGKN